MKMKSKAAILALCLLTGGTLHASIDEEAKPQTADSAQSLRQRLGLWLLRPQNAWDWELEGGCQILQVAPRADFAPAAGLRIRPPDSSWSFEAGAALPHQASGGSFPDVQETLNGTGFDARVYSLWEVHLAAERDWVLRKGWLSGDAGFGVSMMHLTDKVFALTTLPYVVNGVTYTFQSAKTWEDVHNAFCPLFRLGLTFFPESWASLHVDAAYVGYGNTATAGGASFDLGFSGWMVREMVHVRL